MAIEGEKEIEVPAVTTNKWWVLRMVVQGEDVNREPKLFATLRPYWTDANGKDHFVYGEDVNLTEQNLYTYSATRPEIAQAMGAVFIALQTMARERGQI
jgi:hypothetical protein